MELYEQALVGPARESFSIAVGGSIDPALAQFFGTPSGSPGGGAISFVRLFDDDPGQGLYQVALFDPADLTGDILLRFAYDDVNDLVSAAFSLDGGASFQSPFNPIAVTFAGTSTIGWTLSGGEFEARILPAPASASLLAVSLAALGLIQLRRRKV